MCKGHVVSLNVDACLKERLETRQSDKRRQGTVLTFPAGPFISTLSQDKLILWLYFVPFLLQTYHLSYESVELVFIL